MRLRLRAARSIFDMCVGGIFDNDDGKGAAAEATAQEGLKVSAAHIAVSFKYLSKCPT